MCGYRHLVVVSLGSISKVRLLNHRLSSNEEVAELANEWNSVADRADCQALLVDCADVQLLSSEELSRLISLHRRLKREGRKLVLCGLPPECRDVLRWTRLDRLFEIEEKAEGRVGPYRVGVDCGLPA